MTFLITVMLFAVLGVFFYIWWNSRRSSMRSVDHPEVVGRAVTDEAAAAFEDVADEIMGFSNTAAHRSSNRAVRREEKRRTAGV